MAINKIDIKTDKVPYLFNIKLTNFGKVKTYIIKVAYNDVNDFFTLDISDDVGIIIRGVKLVYGNPVFSRIVNTRLPDEVLIPLDPNNIEDTITLENLNTTVFLYSITPGTFL